jgi:hypothetical protein
MSQTTSNTSFLILSVKYPSESQRQNFFRDAGQHSQFTSPFHKPLAASANHEQWGQVINALRENVDKSILEYDDGQRPLKPNDDNYSAFTGSKWEPKGNFSAPPALATMLGSADDEPVPHYDRCSKCAKPAAKRCSRCKIVKYCSRECQSDHWKSPHKQSCIKAQSITLVSAIQGNDGFLVTAGECQEICKGLKKATSNSVIQCFVAYFELAADLDGCFVL